MSLSKDQVKKVAKLANLPISGEEEEKYFLQLSQILDYINQLDQVDSEGVEPIFNVTERYNVLAGDITMEPLNQEKVLQNGHQVNNGFFIAKGVFEGE